MNLERRYLKMNTDDLEKTRDWARSLRNGAHLLTCTGVLLGALGVWMNFENYRSTALLDIALIAAICFANGRTDKRLQDRVLELGHILEQRQQGSLPAV